MYNWTNHKFLFDFFPLQLKNVRTFWWYCKVIMAVCKLALDMQKLSMRRTEQTTLSELYYVNVSGPTPKTGGDKDDQQILFFDKTLFARKRAVSINDYDESGY